ncbi:MAG: hypothetical protein KAS04_03010 [Candidatus Aenigmarchaeota archaeon]|nr:hypothetical protein [Candidatus Aenigmarchaeota archaeon]
MSKGRGNVLITGIGSYRPPHEITNQYLFDNFLSPIPHKQFIRKLMENFSSKKYRKYVEKAIEVVESERGLGVKTRYWDLLPFDGEAPLDKYKKRVKPRDRKTSAKLFNDKSNTQFSDGWKYISDELGLMGEIDENSHTDSAMALKAAKMALYTADIDPKEIGAVFHGTATPDATGGYSEAGRIATTLGIRDDIPVQDIITGCSAAFDSIYAAKSLLMDPTNDIESVLITASNFTSGNVREFFRNKPKGWKAPPGFPGSTSILLFGDGAGAYVLKRAKDDDGTGIINIEKINQAKYNPAFCLSGGSALPMTAKAIELGLEQYYVHHGFVKNTAAKLMRRAVELNTKRAKEKGLGDYHPSTADLVIMHQASKNTLYAAQKEMGIDPAKMVNEVETRGNLVGASIPIAHNIALGRIKEGDIVNFTTIGGGWHAGDISYRAGPESEKMFKRREEYKEKFLK